MLTVKIVSKNHSYCFTGFLNLESFSFLSHITPDNLRPLLLTCALLRAFYALQVLQMDSYAYSPSNLSSFTNHNVSVWFSLIDSVWLQLISPLSTFLRIDNRLLQRIPSQMWPPPRSIWNSSFPFTAHLTTVSLFWNVPHRSPLPHTMPLFCHPILSTSFCKYHLALRRLQDLICVPDHHQWRRSVAESRFLVKFTKLTSRISAVLLSQLLLCSVLTYFLK